MALLLVLLAVGVFVIATSRATSAAAQKAAAASTLSDDYADAAAAVNSEESLERLYRLEPSSAVRTQHDHVANDLVTALRKIRRDGNGDDRAVVARTLAEHELYLAAVDRLFSAVDRADTALAQRIDQDADPSFAQMENLVLRRADAKLAISLAELTHLQRLESRSRRLTPLVFLAGVLLALTLASVTRGHRRLLSLERAQAVHDSLHDGLTGLPNRALLADRIEQALRHDQRWGTRTGLLLIDLDRFKEINDTFGHHHGDELLRQVGSRLSTTLRAVDSVARLGGDEYAVLLPRIHGTDDAHRIASMLARALEAPFPVEGVDLDIEASIGIVLSQDHGNDAATLLQHADTAMYVAKKQNLGVFVYDPATDEHSPAKLALLGDLRRGLDHGELVLHYQPKVSISTADVVGTEALVRWQHPQQGLILPDAFIPLAEHTGLIGPFTRYVLAAALTQLRTWLDAGHAVPVSVNLSARNLLDDRLPKQVAALLAIYGVPAELLVLEVTESAIMTEPVRAVKLLKDLSGLGIKISIDDFGAGYTSLGQLKDLPVSELKIDRSFVTDMTEDPRNSMIVRSVVELGHNLGLSIVAEGVENAHVLALLGEIGCDVAQGYYHSRPLSAEAFDAWRAEWDRAGRASIQSGH
jgi:diguanylate cyclase (GGDEF)-like protein